MIDGFDRKIISILQLDCRRTIAQISSEIGLSLSACARRISNLEQRGVIEGYTARVDAAMLDYHMTFFVEISLDSQTDAALAKFEAAALARPEVLECYLTTGQADYLVRIAAKDTQNYEQIYRTIIAALPHISRIQSSLVMKTVKPWGGYPVD